MGAVIQWESKRDHNSHGLWRQHLSAAPTVQNVSGPGCTGDSCATDQVGHVTTLQHVHVKLLSPVPGCMCHCEGYYTILGVMVRTKGVEDL